MKTADALKCTGKAVVAARIAALRVFGLALLVWASTEAAAGLWSQFAAFAPSWANPIAAAASALADSIVTLFAQAWPPFADDGWRTVALWISAIVAVLLAWGGAAFADLSASSAGTAQPDHAHRFERPVLRAAGLAFMYVMLFGLVWFPLWLTNGWWAAAAVRDFIVGIVDWAYSGTYDWFETLGRALVKTYPAMARWPIDAGVVGVVLLTVAVFGLLFLILRARWPAIKGWIDDRRREIGGLMIGPVDAQFPRPNIRVSRRLAQERKDAITKFLTASAIPPETDIRRVAAAVVVKETVERHQDIQDEPPDTRVVEFLEYPRGSKMRAQAGFVRGYEDIVGQNVRLRFEEKPGTGVDEVIVPLLARVVDAAVLADRHDDAPRDDKSWNSIPLFDRIYAEHRPLGRLGWFLWAATGNVLPARVVIETHYGEVLTTALMFGRQDFDIIFDNWFGIGVKIQKPNLPQDFSTWVAQTIGCDGIDTVKVKRKAASSQHMCKQLKARASGGASAPLEVVTVGEQEVVAYRVVSQSAIADGCPSLLKPKLISRGAISQAPPLGLMPRELEKRDCKGFCDLWNKGAPQTLAIDRTPTKPYERVPVAPGDLPAKYEAMNGRAWYERRVWVGAFFDPELRQANRFPVVGCSAAGESGASTAPPDLRGAFVRDPAGDKPLAGVFVSTLGPQYASNVLVPSALIGAYLLHQKFGRQIELAGAGAVAKHTSVDQKPPKVKAR